MGEEATIDDLVTMINQASTRARIKKQHNEVISKIKSLAASIGLEVKIKGALH